jgi:hypothetical protein
MSQKTFSIIYHYPGFLYILIHMMQQRCAFLHNTLLSTSLLLAQKRFRTLATVSLAHCKHSG